MFQVRVLCSYPLIVLAFGSPAPEEPELLNPYCYLMSLDTFSRRCRNPIPKPQAQIQGVALTAPDSLASRI